MAVTKNPIRTRSALLQSAYEHVRQRGFRAASLNEILADSAGTKGALYHHFPSKYALGYAICDEILAEQTRARWIEPLAETDAPLEALSTALAAHRQSLSEEDILLGSTLANLAAEMSAVDEPFRLRIDEIHAAWVEAIAAALRRGLDAGTVAATVDAAPAALFIVSAITGAAAMAKTAASGDVLAGCYAQLDAYLQTLRPT